MAGVEPAIAVAIVFLIGVITAAYKALGWVRQEIEKGVSPVSLKTVKIEAELDITKKELADYKVEAARTFTTKEDVINANRPVLQSVERLTNSVDSMNSRIDRVIEQSNAAKPVTRRRASST